MGSTFLTGSGTDIELVSHNKGMVAVTHEKRAGGQKKW